MYALNQKLMNLAFNYDPLYENTKLTMTILTRDTAFNSMLSKCMAPNIFTMIIAMTTHTIVAE